MYTRSHIFGRKKKKKQNEGAAATTPTDSSNISGDVSNAQSESNSHEPENSLPPAILDESQCKTSKPRSSLDKLMEAIKPRNLRDHLLANIQAVFDDTTFEGAQPFRTEMDKNLANICGGNEQICNAISTGRDSLQIVVREGLRGSLGHLTERLFTLGVADSRNVLISELSEISKGQTPDGSTIWTNLQQEYCKSNKAKPNNATCANVAKWALEAMIAETSNEIEVGRGSKGKFWVKANRLNEITVLFGRGVLFALDKEVSGSVVEKLATKKGESGSLKSLDASEHQSLKAFLDAIWTILQGDACLRHHSLQAIPKDGIEKVQQLLRHFPYAHFDTLSQYLKPSCQNPIENQKSKFDAILRGTIEARQHQVPQRDQESSHRTHPSIEVLPVNALISSGGPEKRHDVARDDCITGEGSPASQYDAVMRDTWSVLSPPTQLRGPVSSSDACLPTADDSASPSASVTTSINLRFSGRGRSTPVSLISSVSTPPAKHQSPQQSDIHSRSQAKTVDPAHLAAGALYTLSQQNSVSDISRRVQKRSLPPIGEEEQSSKSQRTIDNNAAERGSLLFQSRSLPPRLSASTANLARPKCWTICCPLCRCKGLEDDEFKAHMNDSHLLTDHGKKYYSAIQKPHLFSGKGTDYEVWRRFLKVSLENSSLKCPVCGFGGSNYHLYMGTRKSSTHPLQSILEPYDEGSKIYEHAEEIAVIWPNFATHPVFDLILARADGNCSLS